MDAMLISELIFQKNKTGRTSDKHKAQTHSSKLRHTYLSDQGIEYPPSIQGLCLLETESCRNTTQHNKHWTGDHWILQYMKCLYTCTVMQRSKYCKARWTCYYLLLRFTIPFHNLRILHLKILVHCDKIKECS
jgi:hypothetical protein